MPRAGISRRGAQLLLVTVLMKFLRSEWRESCRLQTLREQGNLDAAVLRFLPPIPAAKTKFLECYKLGTTNALHHAPIHRFFLRIRTSRQPLSAAATTLKFPPRCSKTRNSEVFLRGLSGGPLRTSRLRGLAGC